MSNINKDLEELNRVLAVIVEQQEQILKSLKATVEGFEEFIYNNEEQKTH